MPSIFKKLERGGNRLFHKIEKGGNRVFHKVESTADKLKNEAAHGIDQAGKFVDVAARKTLNSLEKAAPVIDAIGVATGQPEIIAAGGALTAAAESGQKTRSRINNKFSNASNNVKKFTF